MRTPTKRFCDKACSAAWRAQQNRRRVTCLTCKVEFLAPRGQAEQQDRVFCSKRCYLQAHATTPLRCATCGSSFVAAGYRKTAKYCSPECRPPMAGENNPNYGKRHPGMFQHAAEFRLSLSKDRRRQGNPNWRGGSKATGRWRHQTSTAAWARAHLGTNCALCGAANAQLRHIVPGRCFLPRILMQFSQNLVMLCMRHHRRTTRLTNAALGSPRLRDLPFAERLPRSILTALRRDGSVSSPLPGCDYSPLGNVAELIHSSKPWSDKAGLLA
jgi:hypothetical protein